MALPPGIFRLKTASDLFEKLKRDQRALMKDPTNCDLCFNFFVTAHHLPEWHFQADADEARKLRRQHAILRICSQIANGAKHFETRDRNYCTVQATHEPIMLDDQGRVVRDSHFRLSLDEAAAGELGADTISVERLARELLDFWKSRVGRQVVPDTGKPGG